MLPPVTGIAYHQDIGQVASDQRLYEEYFEWTRHYKVEFPAQNEIYRQACVYALRNGRAEKPPIGIAAMRDASTCG